MNAMKLIGLRKMVRQEIPLPQITQPNDVLIQMACVGICGSDVHYFAEGGIGSQRVQYPWTIGHEGAGIVQEIGSAVTRVQPGDRIAIDPALPCWKCDQCLSGRPHTCRSQKFLGCPGQIEGCLAEYLVMPERSCYPIPENVSLEEAALVEPLSIGLYALSLSVPMPGAKVGILGAGPIGLSVLLPARAQGACCVYMADKIPARLELAARAGADWVGNPASDDVVGEISQQEPELLDAVFECSGDQAAIDQGVQLLRPGGKLLLIGIPSSNHISFDINLLRRKELIIQNVRRQNNMVQPAIDLIARKEIDVSLMVTHRLPLAQAQEGFSKVTDYQDGVVKAMVLVHDEKA